MRVAYAGGFRGVVPPGKHSNPAAQFLETGEPAQGGAR